MKKRIFMFFLLTILFIPSFTLAATDCGAFADITSKARDIIMIAAPILLLVLGTVDFMKVVGAGDEKAMRKVLSDFVKRLIICVVILILPILVNLIMGWTKYNDLTACW